MFPPPPVIVAEVFARLPDELRVLANPVLRSGVPRDSLLEGPAFDREGNLYCVDIPYGRIFRVDPGGQFRLVKKYEGNPNGLKIHRDGRIFIADHKLGLLVLEPGSGNLDVLLGSAWGEPFRGLNDLHFASNGDLYFTDQGSTGLEGPEGRVFCLRADGRLDKLLDHVPSPNGIVLTPDEKTLLVAVTRANAVWSVPLNMYAAGVVRRVGCFINLSGGTGPDGLAMSADGHLCVAHVGMGVIWVFDRRGIPVLRVDSPVGHGTTNMAFGGADGKSLFVTESATGVILRASLPFEGMRMYSHST